MDLKELSRQVVEWSRVSSHQQVLIERSPNDLHYKVLERERLKKRKVAFLRHEAVQRRISKLTEELDEYGGQLTELPEEMVQKKLYDPGLLDQESDDLISYL